MQSRVDTHTTSETLLIKRAKSHTDKEKETLTYFKKLSKLVKFLLLILVQTAAAKEAVNTALGILVSLLVLNGQLNFI